MQKPTKTQMADKSFAGWFDLDYGIVGKAQIDNVNRCERVARQLLNGGPINGHPEVIFNEVDIDHVKAFQDALAHWFDGHTYAPSVKGLAKMLWEHLTEDEVKAVQRGITKAKRMLAEKA